MNEQFNNNEYGLVRVRYMTGGRSDYIYAVKKSMGVATGDIVVVLVGTGDTFESMKVVEVTGYTDNIVKHLPKDFEIKEVVCKVK